MAKYHWGRITGDPEIIRELMVTLEVEEEDEDMLWAQLPDVCSEDALGFRNAGLLLKLEGYAPNQRGNWSIILLVEKYFYAGDVCIGDDAGPFDSLDEALACAPKFDSISTAGSNFEIRSELPFHQTLEVLAKHLPEGAYINVNLKPLIMARGSLRPDANYLGQRIIDLLQSKVPRTPADDAELDRLFPVETPLTTSIEVDFAALFSADPKLSKLLKGGIFINNSDSELQALVSRNDPDEIWGKIRPSQPLLIMIGGPENLGGEELGVYEWGGHYFACRCIEPCQISGPYTSLKEACGSKDLAWVMDTDSKLGTGCDNLDLEIYTDLPEAELLELVARMGSEGTTMGVWPKWGRTVETQSAIKYYKSESGYVRA
jgi:hypothetical protein